MSEEVKYAPIDLSAPWHLAEASIQREAPGRGRYRARARFISGNPPNYSYCTVSFWLPAEDGERALTRWLAYREITNSRRHPSEFDGMELPTTAGRADFPVDSEKSEKGRLVA